eukprot:COSAG06_NODE_937_length_11402_cov_4.495709_4_plen_57_part_00
MRPWSPIAAGELLQAVLPHRGGIELHAPEAFGRELLHEGDVATQHLVDCGPTEVRS